MWRPNDWKNPYKGVKGFNPFDTIHLINKRDTFEAGADAMLKALRKNCGVEIHDKETLKIPMRYTSVKIIAVPDEENDGNN